MTSHPLAFLNTSIATALPGDDPNYSFTRYSFTRLTVTEARELIAAAIGEGRGILSAVGHEASAAVLTELMEHPIPMNRIQFQHQVGQWAVVLKLRGRVELGTDLSREIIDEIGYDLYLMLREA